MHIRFHARRIALACTLPWIALAAHAQAQDLAPAALPPLGTQGGVAGLGLSAAPLYSGSNDERLRAVPILGYQWANGWFASTTQGVGVNLSPSADLQYGPRLTVDLGRRERSDTPLRGMGEVKPSAELGGFLNYRALGSLWLNASLRAGAGEDHRGARLDLGASYSQPLGPGLRLRLGAGTTLVNQAYAQTRYGVTAEQSLNSGNATYSPSGGVQDVHGSVGLSYALAPRVTLSTTITARRLLDPAKDSPLVSKTNPVSGVLALTYGF